jgi:pyridoxine 5-phosphate synthase
MPATHQRLYINVDHIATVRQARRTDEPDPAGAVPLCERAGADGITAHLREDRRHIHDRDVEALLRVTKTVLNLEMALTEEIRLRPFQVTLVPERREEITTEGGLDVMRDPERLREGVERLKRAGVRVSLFIAPDERAVERSREVGAGAIELHTGQYSHAPDDPKMIDALRRSAALGARLGVAVHAGHGLTVRNVGPVASVPEIEELNIGHSIISRAIFVGIETAVREMRAAMDAARGERR